MHDCSIIQRPFASSPQRLPALPVDLRGGREVSTLLSELLIAPRLSPRSAHRAATFLQGLRRPRVGLKPGFRTSPRERERKWSWVGRGGRKKKTTKQRLTWSRLAFTPLAAHQNFDDLDVSVEAGFTAAEQTWGGGERGFLDRSPLWWWWWWCGHLGA